MRQRVKRAAFNDVVLDVRNSAEQRAHFSRTTAAGVTANVDAVDCARFYLYHPLKDPDAMRAAHARASAPASPAPAPATPPASNAGATRIAYVHVPKCGSSFQSMLLLAGCPGITPPELAAAIGVKIKIGPTAICL